MRLKHVGFHLVAYYVAWFACVLTAAQGVEWWGLVTVLVIVAVQYYWQYQRHDTQDLGLFAVVLVGLGFIMDTSFLWLHWIQFQANPWPITLSPPWMLGIWLSFAMVLYACLRKYFLRYVGLAVLSLVGFPLAYIAGVKLGAASLPQGYIGVIKIGAVWAVLLPTVTYTYTKLGFGGQDV